MRLVVVEKCPHFKRSFAITSYEYDCSGRTDRSIGSGIFSNALETGDGN